MKVCVTGDNGLLGQALVKMLAERPFQILGVSRSENYFNHYWQATVPACFTHRSFDLIDKTQESSFLKCLADFGPDILINCVALANVDACEKDPAFAESLNADLPGRLARAAREHGARFVHISTDQVFDGRKKTSYSETDVVNPLNVYGKTKLRGEENALSVCPTSLVVRTNLVGFRGDTSRPTFAEWLVGALAEGQKITLADDFVTSPIHVLDLSYLMIRMLEQNIQGVLNIATADSVSKYDFGRVLAGELKVEFSNVVKGRIAELNLKPQRPPYLALDTSRAQGLLQQAQLPTVMDTIKALAHDVNSLSGAPKWVKIPAQK